MALTHPTPATDDTVGDSIPENAANAQRDALERVLPHLTVSGVNAQLVKRCSSNPGQSGPESPAEPLWHPPQLVIYADAGWKVATVTLGARSGSYMVELARVADDNAALADRMRVVPEHRPQDVALEIAMSMGHT
ncbi:MULTISPECIES: hypothetical protein [unclassified Nonomuraea]|uniref:hypothetical protein n=1 Tax=unclassified Nonomuraea TaxID=2593643 RepID=UPI003409BF78